MGRLTLKATFIIGFIAFFMLFLPAKGDMQINKPINASNSLFFPSHLQTSLTKKLGNSLTLKINKDLFDKGVTLKTAGYGHYFATLEANNLLDIRSGPSFPNRLTTFKPNSSLMNGGLRLGGYVAPHSKVFLKVGFHRENFGQANTLKAPTSNPLKEGYWKTGFAPGVGFEYTLTQKWVVSGECTTLAKQSSSPLSIKSQGNLKSRNNRVMIGVQYKLGAED